MANPNPVKPVSKINRLKKALGQTMISIDDIIRFNSADLLADFLAYIGGADPVIGMPTAAVQAFAGATAPTGWLLCYGQAVSRTTYADLFAVVSTTYGAGNGTTTFNLPDLRGRAIAGKDDMGGTAASRLTTTGLGATAIVLGHAGGGETHTLTTSELPSHSHAIGTTLSSGTAASVAAIGTDNSPSESITSGTTGSDSAHANVQPTFILNYIIKY
jgi:microcystin-dependent protein